MLDSYSICHSGVFASLDWCVYVCHLRDLSHLFFFVNHETWSGFYLVQGIQFEEKHLPDAAAAGSSFQQAAGSIVWKSVWKQQNPYKS